MAEESQPPKSKIAEREEAILKFWEQNQVFRKTLEKKSPKGEFVFYEGPPFATVMKNGLRLLGISVPERM